MRILLKFADIIDLVNTRVAQIIAWLILAIAGVSLFEIISRYFFNKPTQWAGQIMSILFYILVVISIGWVLKEEGHIRMDVLYGRWNPRQKSIADISTFIILLIFVVFLGFELIDMAWTSLITNERVWAPFRGPIYPKKIALALGIILFLLQGLAYLIHRIQIIKNHTLDIEK